VRAILEKAPVKRTGVQAELVKALFELVEKEMVVRGEAVGEAELPGKAAKAEIARLTALGLGPKRRARGQPRAARPAGQPRAARTPWPPKVHKAKEGG